MIEHILTAIITIGIMGALFGALLGFSSIKFKVKEDPIVDELDAMLPQTQCGQCGYPGCKPYAIAVSQGEKINKCIPGGDPVMQQLAQRMNIDPEAIEGEEKPKALAFINEDMCIGCTKCIQVCPVDAIIGTARQMHTVINDECTGCELCVPVCPTDCIEMRPIEQNINNWRWGDKIIPTSDISEDKLNENDINKNKNAEKTI